MKEVVITAGGTREKIDDVRYIGNFSSGRLGHRMAEVFGKWLKGNVTLLAPQSTIDRFGLPDNVTHEPFMSARDLREKLLGIKTADMVIHSAAVSDYTPEFQPGKICSDQEDLTITLKRNPKIISELRNHFGESTKLVGFKLLSGASDGELHYAAQKQIHDNELDYCIANDLQKIRDGNREVHIVKKPRPVRNWSEPYGAHHMWQMFNGDTETVGQRIVRHLSHEVDNAIRSEPYEVEWCGMKLTIDPTDY